MCFWGNRISHVISSKHTRARFPHEASDTQNHLLLLAHRHTLNCANKNICRRKTQRKIPTLPPDRGIADPGAMKAGRLHFSFPTIKLLIFLLPLLSTCTQLPHHPLLPSAPHLGTPCSKLPGWPCTHSVSVQGRKSYLADVRHLILYGRKLLSEINTRPSLNLCTYTCTRLECFCDLLCRKQSSCYGL